MDSVSTLFVPDLRRMLQVVEELCNPNAAEDKSREATSDTLRIRGHILLHFQIVEHIEIGIQILVLLQRLQIPHRRARFRRSGKPRRS